MGSIAHPVLAVPVSFMFGEQRATAVGWVAAIAILALIGILSWQVVRWRRCPRCRQCGGRQRRVGERIVYDQRYLLAEIWPVLHCRRCGHTVDPPPVAQLRPPPERWQEAEPDRVCPKRNAPHRRTGRGTGPL